MECVEKKKSLEQNISIYRQVNVNQVAFRIAAVVAKELAQIELCQLEKESCILVSVSSAFKLGKE